MGVSENSKQSNSGIENDNILLTAVQNWILRPFFYLEKRE